MQRLALLSVALVVAGLIGCNTDKGGKKDDNTPNNETFRMTGPQTSTTIKQGNKETVKVSVNRGSKFQEDITFSADEAKGLKVELDPKVLKASEKKDLEVTVTADADAAIGDKVIKITGKPAKGSEATVDVKVKVEEKNK